MCIFVYLWFVPHSIVCWLIYGYMACTHISVCEHARTCCENSKCEVSLACFWRQSHLVKWNCAVGHISKECSKFETSESTHTTMQRYISKDMNLVLSKCDAVHNVFFKKNSLQLHFSWMEMLAITDWHTCAIYAAIYINLICIFKASIQLLVIYVPKHSPCIKEVNI